MGVLAVFLANYGVNARKVVVKKLKGESIESKQRLSKEAEMLSGISAYENIPTWYWVFRQWFNDGICRV